MLIVRDLFSGPHRFGELEHSLAPIPTSVLATRLKDLENAGIIQRVPVTSPRRGTAYTLTDDGRALEPTLVALGRWGAERMGEPRPGRASRPSRWRWRYAPPTPRRAPWKASSNCTWPTSCSAS
ncbi:winged helix-turn-helix transcriptional regulator [Tessaracoccus aquimaris]|uniref:winged helix-turn-helix transcriptional regulator n=1 Tax=Tessaracoccus aquimaris TaxID=1332264 RepID=UPI001D05A748